MKVRKLIEGAETDSLGNQLTPEQSRYFARSKVRDTKGRLLVCYHGTNTKFSSFEHVKKGMQLGADLGFWFTPNVNVARRFTQVPGDDDLEEFLKWKGAKEDEFANKVSDLLIPYIKGLPENNKKSIIKCAMLFGVNQHLKDKFDLNDIPKDVEDKIENIADEYMTFYHTDTSNLRGEFEKTYTPKSTPTLISAYLNIKKLKILNGGDIGVGWTRFNEISAAEDEGYDGVLIKSGDTGQGIADEYVVFNPNQIKLITNKAPTSSSKLMEDTLGGNLIAEPNVYVDFINELHSTFNSMSTEQLISFLNINQRNDLDTESPMFILPNGKFVSVQETLDTNGVDVDELTHQSICECFAWCLMSNLKYDTDTVAEIVDQDWRLERELGDFLTELTYKLGWARINCGTKAVDRRFYGVLPNDVTNKQWWSFETWLNWGYDNNKSDVLVFVTDEAIAKKFKMNDFAPIFPEDIIKTIRRFYSSGRFYESVSDKKLTERLQRLAPNAFITDSPYQVRDLLMNKPKLYRILYDKNIDMYMIGDGNEVIHWELIEAAYEQGYYYTMDDFIDEIGTLDNYVEFGQGGQFLGDEEIESYLIYMVFSPDEEEFMLGEDGYQFRYKLPFGYIYTRDCYLEDCDLYNVVKRNITINEEKKMRNLIEGVWALPDNQRKVNIIKRLFKKEITADDIDKVKDTLYNVLGSDELFDSFDSEEDVDYRYNIAGYLRDFLDNYSDKIDKELVDQLEETIGSFDRMYKKRVKESYIHTNSSGNPCDLVCGSALKVGDSVYDDKSGHKLDVIEVEEMNSWSKYITFNDTVTGKTEQRHVGNLALFELAGEGDEQVEVDDDIEIEWHPIDDYFDGNI